MNGSKPVPFPYDPPAASAVEPSKPRLMRIEREGPVLVVPRTMLPGSAPELRHTQSGALRSVVRKVQRAMRRLQSRLMRGPARPKLIRRS